MHTYRRGRRSTLPEWVISEYLEQKTDGGFEIVDMPMTSEPIRSDDVPQWVKDAFVADQMAKSNHDTT